MKIIEIIISKIDPKPNVDGQPNYMQFGIVFTTHVWQYPGWFVAVYRIARSCNSNPTHGIELLAVLLVPKFLCVGADPHFRLAQWCTKKIDSNAVFVWRQN